jgi:hypothetical protein
MDNIFEHKWFRPCQFTLWQRVKLYFSRPQYFVEVGSGVDMCVRYKKMDGKIVIEYIGKVSEAVK